MDDCSGITLNSGIKYQFRSIYMTSPTNLLIFIAMSMSGLLLNSCEKKPDVPLLSTSEITNITQTSAVTGGTISSDGGAEVTARGVCWSTAQNPTISDNKTSDGTGKGSFVSNITGLTADTRYYVCAYATNIIGTAYGNEVSFTTSPVIPATVITAEVSSVTSSTAVSGGSISSDGGGQITEKGVCWSTSENPTISDYKTSDGTGTDSFISNMTGLEPATTYHVRAYAINSAGTGYGNEAIFTTLAALPVISTSPVSNVTQTSAESGGIITFDGGAEITNRGVCWNESGNPTIDDAKTSDGAGTGSFSSAITGLTPNTIYYVRAFATNSIGTAYGNEISFISAGIEIKGDFHLKTFISPKMNFGK